MLKGEIIDYIRALARTARLMSGYGWSERNAGNISMLLPCNGTEFPASAPKRSFRLSFDASELNGRVFLVTGTGEYFRNLALSPKEKLGIVRVKGTELELLWGFQNGGAPTSEISAHLRSHAVRLRENPAHSVICHTHPTNLIAMSAVHSLDEREFTRTLWKQCSECLMFLPDGVGVLPWLPCGDDRIGAATAEKMRGFRVVLWANHGIFAAGNGFDDALGSIEIAEKAAELYLKTAHLPIRQNISDVQLLELARLCKLSVKEGYLNV
ncbi:MAG: rhamnulose-1-phosphate aldolase [Oscillospiraceae bacterium]|jgi:rhamnulose-1-phosphate aldolase|nr:rhamnulose-1-phosphate aldolase [Oscillospiraceae bacterium]